MSKKNEIKFEIKLQRKFSRSSDYSEFAMARVHNNVISELGGSGLWVKIRSLDHDGKSVYRVVRGHGNDNTFPSNAIEMDYNTSKNDLKIAAQKAAVINEKGDLYGCNLEITPATSAVDLFLAHWRHPDPGYRFPVRISMVSLVLGVIGFLLGVLSLCQ